MTEVVSDRAERIDETTPERLRRAAGALRLLSARAIGLFPARTTPIARAASAAGRLDVVPRADGGAGQFVE